MPNQIRSVELHDLYVCRRGDEEIPVYPLTVGVTGHRRILETAVEAAREQTRDLLTRLAEYWRKEQGARDGEISPAPLVVFNGLAAGADSLVAEEAVRLKQTRPELNVKLVAVLPAPQTIYEQDFTSSDEVDEFRRLLENADSVVEIDLTEDNRRWLEKNPGAELPWDYRKAQYEALGRSLAESSLYVLALWDGVEARLENDETVVADERGGTADVVRMKTTAVPPAGFQGRCEMQPYGAVLHVATPRDGDAPTSVFGLKPGRCFVCVRDETQGNDWRPRLRRCALDDFDAFFETRSARARVKSALQWGATAIQTYLRAWAEAARRPRETKPTEAPRNWRKRVAAIIDAAETTFFRMALEPYDRLTEESRALAEAKKPLKETARFNRDVVADYESEEARQARRDSVKYLLEDDYAEVDDDTKFLVGRYAVADSASLAFQKKFFRTASVYFGVLLFFNVVIYAREFLEISEIGGSTFYRWGVSGAYYFFLLVIIAMFLRQNKWAYYERYHRYRALAEALRVQIFWRAVGITDVVGDAYWTHQIKELNWLRFTAKSSTAFVGAPAGGDYTIAFLRWAQAQRQYLETRIRSYRRKERVLGTLGMIFVGTFLALLAIFQGLWAFGVGSVYLTTGDVLTSAASFIALCCFSWNRLRAYGSQRKRYVKSLPIYRRVEKGLEELNAKAVAIGADVEKIERERQKWLRYLGEIALSENADWFLAKRRLELPK